MIRIQISEDALKDLNEGFLFYEFQDPGLGDYFVTQLRADIERLKLTAGSHQIVYRDFHRLLSRVFPYGVFYTVNDDAATVWAVIDLRRDPDWIHNRLTDE